MNDVMNAVRLMGDVALLSDGELEAPHPDDTIYVLASAGEGVTHDWDAIEMDLGRRGLQLTDPAEIPTELVCNEGEGVDVKIYVEMIGGGVW